jgi:hypothetical protein
MSTTHAPVRGAGTRTPVRAEAVAVDPDEATRVLGQLAALLGLAFGLVAFAFEPLLFGAVGITLGLVGKHTGASVGRVAVGVAMVATVLGPTFGSVVHAALLGG